MAMAKGPGGKPMAFHDFPAEAFPVTLTAHLDSQAGEILWKREVQPYVVTDIPAAGEYAGRIWIHLETADGDEIWEEPMTAAEAKAHIAQAVGDDDA